MIPSMLRVALVALALALPLLAAPNPSAAQIYRWIDERGNAHYAEGLDSVPERYRARAVPLGLRKSPPEPAVPAPGGKPAATGATTIRFRPGERIMVDARINGRASARLLLDTGADRTLVSPRALVAAGVSLTRGGVSGQLTGVTGTTEAQGVTVDSLEVGEARVSRLLVVSHDINQPGLDGLLGRDFLEQFTVTIDSARGVVTLAPK